MVSRATAASPVSICSGASGTSRGTVVVLYPPRRTVLGALAALCLVAGCPSGDDGGEVAAYDVLPLGSLNGFGLDRTDAVGQSTAVLNNKRQIVGVRAGAPTGQPFLFEDGVFYDVLPPGGDLDQLAFPQLNEVGDIYFPTIRAQVGVFRASNNVWTRVSSGASYGNEYITNTYLSDDRTIYGVHSQVNVPFRDPSATRRWQAGVWTELGTLDNPPPVNGSGSSDMDYRGVRGVNATGTMVMSHIASVTSGGNGLPVQKCWVQDLDGSRVDLLPLVENGWAVDPLGINDLGQIAGTVTLGSNGFGGSFPFLFKDGDVFLLGTEPGVALAMNNVGDVLYRVRQKTAILYRADGTKADLTSVLAAETHVYGMNDNRDIFVSDATGAFLLVPRP